MSTAFTSEQRRTLEFGPFWILSMVVGRYRGFDPFTVDAFDNALASAEHPPGLVHDVVVAVRDRLPDLLVEFEADRRTIVTGLLEVDGLLARLPDEEDEGFRNMLVQTVGMGVARARGPFGVEATREDLERVELAAAIVSPTPALGAAYDDYNPSVTAGQSWFLGRADRI